VTPSSALIEPKLAGAPTTAVVLWGASCLATQASYGFLQLVNHLQGWIFTDLPGRLGLTESASDAGHRLQVPSVQDGHLTLVIGQLQPPRVAPRLRSLPPRSATDDGIMSDHRSCRPKLTGDGACSHRQRPTA
jgi:hypothetical protein